VYCLEEQCGIFFSFFFPLFHLLKAFFGSLRRNVERRTRLGGRSSEFPFCSWLPVLPRPLPLPLFTSLPLAFSLSNPLGTVGPHFSLDLFVRSLTPFFGVLATYMSKRTEPEE
jgi:hypothetical protein